MSASESAPRPSSPGTARNVLIVLTFVNLFNYIDRLIVPGLAKSLALAPGLMLDRKHIGLLGTGMIVVYAIASPWFGRLGDLYHRPRLIALGVGIWSIATVLGGFAVSFITLFLARAVLGVGEAAYGSIAPSLLADSFPRHLRGRVFSVFYAAIPVGSALGFVIAGGMDAHFGWRSAFFVAGAPGLILALLLLKLPEVPRGVQDEGDDAVPHHGSVRGNQFAVYLGLLKIRQYRTTVFGYAAYTFALGALVFWFGDFLVSYHGMVQEKADNLVGGIAVVTGFAGTFAGGWIGDYALKYTKHAYLLVSGIATLIAVPFSIIALTATAPALFITGLVVAELMLFASTGPINSAIVNYVAPGQRATAMAFSILVMHLLGDAPSPAIVGAISNASELAGTSNGAALQHAMMILPVAIFISGVIWTVGGLRRDR